MILSTKTDVGWYRVSFTFLLDLKIQLGQMNSYYHLLVKAG